MGCEYVSLEFKDIGARERKLGDWDSVVLQIMRLEEVTSPHHQMLR